MSVTANKDGESPYSSNEIVKLLMPKHAKDNAQYSASRGYKNGFVWFDRPQLAKGDMRVRPVGLGGYVCSGIILVVANDYYGNVGRARAGSVGAKNSP